MINSVISVNCDVCYNRGHIFLGDNNDYHIEPCECVNGDLLS